MIYPNKLNLGDTIGLICPSSGVSYHRALQCKSIIEEMGYRAKLASNITCQHCGYMAGDELLRAHWVNTMFCDPEIAAIFCIRGGHGASRIMSHLDYPSIQKHPKIFVGYSDVTCIHSGIANHCNFITFHGPMVSSDMVPTFDELSKDSLFQTINATKEYQLCTSPKQEFGVLKSGYATGPLTGGNLALLSASFGTPHEIDTKDKILFIEEIDETVSRIDRFVHQLKYAKKFDQCAGVILGQFTQCTNNHCPTYTPLALFEELVQEYSFPVLYNVECGHCTPNITLPLGATCTIDTHHNTISFGTPNRDPTKLTGGER